ncbi:MAG: recombinase family protein [Bacillota bacterium]
MNAVIYARYSSDNQREEFIEGQLRECNEYADRYGLTVIGTYIDRALSAKTDDRPEFQRMIRDSAKRLFEVVLVWKLDRFARSRTDSAMNKFILKKNGVRVISAKENISDGPEGIILEAMLEGYAEYYSAELSEKIIRGLTENALKGKYNGGGLPLGYTTDSAQHFQIDPLTAPIVQEIFTRYADGETVKDITYSLNARGLVSSRGAAFNKNSLHDMLKNRKYIGEYRYRDIVHPDVIPSIISKELFTLVQKRLEKNKKAPAKKKAIVEYLLTTKLFCGKCGAFMVGESGRSKTGWMYHYYKCAKAKREKVCDKKPIKKDFIERLVVSETKRIVFQDDMINWLADAIVEYQKKLLYLVCSSSSRKRKKALRICLTPYSRAL